MGATLRERAVCLPAHPKMMTPSTGKKAALRHRTHATRLSAVSDPLSRRTDTPDAMQARPDAGGVALAPARRTRSRAHARQHESVRRGGTSLRPFGVGAVALAGLSGIAALVGRGGDWRRVTILGHPPVQLGIVVLAGISVAVADTLIKRAAVSSLSLSAALAHPLVLLALALYGLQILLCAYVFVQHWDLSTVGLAQMVVYAATVIVGGLLLFQERLTLAHGVGLALALIAALLMNV